VKVNRAPSEYVSYWYVKVNRAPSEYVSYWYVID